MSYYKEEIIKNTSFRENYKNGIDSFLEKSLISANEKRYEYFNPDSYIKNPQKYRDAFTDMLGFPLRESCNGKIRAKKHLLMRIQT